MSEVYVIDAARNPVGKRNGYLREWPGPELLGVVLDAIVERTGIDPATIDDVIAGCGAQVGEQAASIGRNAIFATKTIPNTVPGCAVNRFCGSSLTALQMAYGMIASGTMDLIIAAGVETMSRIPLGGDVGVTLADGRPGGLPFGAYFLERHVHGKMYNLAQAAQKIGELWGITRLQCEEAAVASHMRAHHATVSGYFKNEIVPTTGLDKEGNAITVEVDETIRPDTNMEKLATLEAALDSDWITAGISSPITDGASAVMLASAERVKELGLKPMARIVENAVSATDPDLVLTGPMFATPKVLDRAGLKVDDIDIFECNEAFAPVPLAWAKELGISMEKTNVNGGALALGHPIGNSGTRLVTTGVHELVRRQGRYALVTMCTAGAMAPATIFERV